MTVFGMLKIWKSGYNMCYECGCYGAVNPYGVGGSAVGKPAKAKGGVPTRMNQPKYIEVGKYENEPKDKD